MNNRYSVSLSLAILSVAALVSGSTATTMVYASSHATSSSNTGSPSSTPSTSGLSSSGPSTSGSSSTPSTSGSYSTPSGLSTGSSSASSSVGSSGPSSSGSSSGSGSGGSTAHCDRPGYPSCSSLGSEAGKMSLGLVVLLVTARLFVVHITLEQEPPLLLPSQALPLKKGILQQAQSVIIPHRPTRQMLHIAINQPIHLAIV